MTSRVLKRVWNVSFKMEDLCGNCFGK